MKKWRLLNFEVNNGAMQMAIDEAIMEAIRLQKAPNTVRFYQIKPKILTIGCHQKSNEMKQTFVRRLTGGGAVMHDNDLTYAFVFAENSEFNNFEKSYFLVGDCLINGFRENNLAVEYSAQKHKKKSPYCCNNENYYDLVYRDKKVAGNALVQSRGVFLQQGVIFNLSVDCDFMKKMILGMEKQLLSLNIVLEEGDLTLFEKQLALEIAAEKYQTEAWNKKI